MYIEIPKYMQHIMIRMSCSFARFSHNSATSTEPPKIRAIVKGIIVRKPEPNNVDESPIITRVPRVNSNIERTDTFV